METPPAEPKYWLMSEITDKAGWCRFVATLFPSDTRSSRCCNTLNALAAHIQALPDTHALFNKLAQINRVDDTVRERWLDEIHLEFSYIGYLLNEGAPQAVQRLIQITDASLAEWQQANRLH